MGYVDSGREAVAATDLGGKRDVGMVSFFWFRTTLTIPMSAVDFDTSGAKEVLRVDVDDYARVWVNA